MPTKLGEKYPVSWRGNYPHMLQEDFSTWESFLDQHASDFLHFYYDVRVGGPHLDGFNVEEPWATMWYDLNAKRIDAIAVMESKLWLIEVTARPGMRAIGQLATYLSLWSDDPKLKLPIVPVLVSDSVSTDIQQVLKQYGMLAFSVQQS